MRLLLLPVLILPACVAGQAQFDARILGYEGLNYACDGVVHPRLKIANNGSEVMNTCVVETWKNGIIDNSFNWELAVGAVQAEVRQPLLPAVDVVDGDVLQFHIISVNGQPDEVADGNVLDREIDDSPLEASTSLVRVDVSVQGEGGGFTWALHDVQGGVVAIEGPFAPGIAQERWVGLDPGACYELRVRPTTGGAFFDSEVTLSSGGVQLITVNDLGTDLEEREGVIAGTVMSVVEEGYDGVLVHPNPAHGMVWVALPQGMSNTTVRLLDATGRQVLVENVRGSGPVGIDLSGIAPGRYLLIGQDLSGPGTHEVLVVE